MATFRTDLQYLPSLRDDSPRAAQLRRRLAVGSGLLLFFLGMLAAAGLAEVVGVLLLVLIAAGAVAFLRDRRRRKWLSLRLAVVGERAVFAVRDRARPGHRSDVGERTAISDGDALRCQALAMRLRRSGHPVRAIPLHQSARLIFAETGNRRGEALALNGLGLALASAGQHEEAVGHFDQARRLLHELGDHECEGKVLVNFGLAKRQLGADYEATELLRAAQAKFVPHTYPYELAERHLAECGGA